MNYRDKKILVCGMGKSGAAAARLLRRMGAIVTLQDLQQEPDLGDGFDLAGYLTYFGRNPDDIVSDFDMLVVSPGIPTDLPFFSKAFNCGIPIIGELELAAACCTNPILAITGTNGKTTTTSILGEIIRAWRPGSHVVGNIGIPFCSIADSLDEDAFVVVEVSSFQLETIRDFRPKVSAVLNITPDHLNRHKTMENYIAMKERIFENQDESDYVVLNLDNPITSAMHNKPRAQVIGFSAEAASLGCSRPIQPAIYLKNDEIQINWQNYTGSIIKISDLAIPGQHNIENAMASVAMAAAAGVPMDVISRGLTDFRAVEHRIEFTREVGGVKYYNDSKATNVDSAIKGLLAMSGPILLIGGGRDKDQDFGEWITLFEGRVKHFVCIGEATDKILQTCKAYGFEEIYRANTMRDAVSICASKAAAGDNVLLSPACASYDMFSDYEQRGRVFKGFVMEL